MKKSILALSVILGLGIGFVGIPNQESIVTPICQAAEIVNNAEMITADGFGVFPAGRPAAQAKIMARRAAIMDAQRNLLDIIKGTAVDAESTMLDNIVQSDLVKTKVSGIVTGARIVSEEIQSDGSYHIVMSVPAYGVGSVADVAITQKLQNEGVVTPKPLPAPTPGAAQTYTPAPQASIAGGYTGVVIDARGSALVRTFCPAIFDTNGRAIYGVHNVDSHFAINQGVVEYAEGPARWNEMGIGNTRAGSNPLIIKMVSLRERCTNKCDVIISVEDADKILLENQKSNMLSRYAVVFAK